MLIQSANPGKAQTVRMKDIAAQPLIFLAPASPRQLLEQAFPAVARNTDHDGTDQCGHDQVLCRRGLGVSLISASFARNEVRRAK